VVDASAHSFPVGAETGAATLHLRIAMVKMGVLIGEQKLNI
jgi:hypothetical protein